MLTENATGRDDGPLPMHAFRPRHPHPELRRLLVRDLQERTIKTTSSDTHTKTIAAEPWRRHTSLLHQLTRSYHATINAILNGTHV